MKIFTITENDANQRLDKFLKKLFPQATRGLIYKFNRKGKIKISSSSGEKVGFHQKDNEYKLIIGDFIKIFLNDDEFKVLIENNNPSQPSLNTNGNSNQEKFSKKDIVFEDADLLIINKNPGINVHPGDHKTMEISLINQVHDYLGDKLNSLTFKPSLIHRIDRDTSGIIMIAKKKDILTKLGEDFKKSGKLSKIKKTYLAYVFGKLPSKTGTINKKLLRIEGARNENKVQVSDKGLEAITHYKLISENTIKTTEGNIIISEVEVNIDTGRMHQIRVHMADLGNPIICDDKYGDKKLNSYIKRNFGLDRQALHSSKINFFHYGKNKNMELKANLKEDMSKFLEKVKN